MATILDALQDADYNFRHYHRCGPDIEGAAMRIAKNKLHNAAILLDKGYSLDDEIDSILEEYDDVDDVPDYDEESEHFPCLTEE